MPNPPIIHLQHRQQEHSASCLAACVVMVLSQWNFTVTEAEVRRVLRTKPYSGTQAINLLRLSEFGFDAWPQEGSVAELQRRVGDGAPLIVFLWTGLLRYDGEPDNVDYLHTLVVVGWTAKTVWVHDPALQSGPTEVAWDKFVAAWGFSRQMMAMIEPHKE